MNISCSPLKAFFDVGSDIINPEMAGVVSVEEAEDCGREFGRGKDFVDFPPAKPFSEHFHQRSDIILGFEGT